jgi:DNA-directed RNA polymerase I and III subunit RPAC2
LNIEIRADESPDVEYCGYSAPHPSETKIHLRIQMYGKSASLIPEVKLINRWSVSG